MKLRSSTKRRKAQQAAAQKKRRLQIEPKLNKPIDFATKAHDAILEGAFHDFEQHPECAALLYHLNSGHHKFHQVEKLIRCKNSTRKRKRHTEQLKKEIEDEILTEDEMNKLLDEFLIAQGRAKSTGLNGLSDSVHAHHLVCGMCGIKSVNNQQHRQCTVVPLEKLPPVALLTQHQLKNHHDLQSQGPLMLPINSEGKLAPFHPHKVLSVYESPKLKKAFHLHPEFVHVGKDSSGQDCEMTVLCHKCSRWFKEGGIHGWKEAPPNSIASGLDFGSRTRVGLCEPSATEMIVIARVRHFHNVVKIQNNHRLGCRSDFTTSQLRSHSISFRHDAPIVGSIATMTAVLDSQENQSVDDLVGVITSVLRRSITIQLVGPDASQDKLCHRAQKQAILQIKAHNVWQWLSVLQVCHESYKGDPKLHALSNFSEFKKAVSKAGQQVFKDAAAVSSTMDLVSDLIVGDDIAQVRSGILTRSKLAMIQKDKTGANDQSTMMVSHSLVTDASPIQKSVDVAMKENQKLADHLAEIAESFNVKIPCKEARHSDEEQQDSWVSLREEEPMCEFTDMQALLVGAFPNVFMLGRTYPQKNLLSPQEMEHLLLQHTNAAATNRELLFYLFDCKARHRVIKNLATKVKKDPGAFNSYAKLINSVEFKELVKEANQDPSSKAASQVMQQVLPVLAFGARNNMMSGVAGDTTILTEGMCMAKRYGPNKTLVTVTPDDINTPGVLRFAMVSVDNKSFPATVDEEFFEKLRAGGAVRKGDVQIPLDYSSRFKAAAHNPVAVALEFRNMMENIVQILIGCPLDFQPGCNSSQKRTWHFKSNAANSPHHKGVFGHAAAYFGCIETQARGALHFHIVLWGGITPDLLEKAASFPEVCTSIQKALDSMFVAHLPRSVHLKNMLAKKMKETAAGRAALPTFCKTYPSMKCVPSPSMQQKWDFDFWDNTLKTGIHEHSFSCHKPPAGRHRCRGARPAGDCPATLPALLEIPSEVATMPMNKQNRRTLSSITPVKSVKPIPPIPDPSIRDCFRQPVPSLCQDLVVWELKRPLLEPLEELPNHLIEAVNAANCAISDSQLPPTKMCCSPVHDALEDQENNVAFMLACAKEWCIQKILACLKEDSRATDDNAIMAFTHWFATLNPLQMVTIYNDLKHQICTANGLVTETNQALSNATGASTNAILIGNTQQASAALFYVLPYVCKSKFALEACLLALENAQHHIAKFPSKAPDTGTDTRCVQHLFTKVLNDLSRSVELSDTQVALDLLNTTSKITSDSYRFFGADCSVNHFLSHMNDSRHLHTMAEAGIDCELDLEELARMAGTDPDEVLCKSTPSSNFGPASIYKVPLKDGNSLSVPVHYPTHWWHRGEELKMLTQMEYAALVSVIPVPKADDTIVEKSKTGKRGRRKRRTFPFQNGHPLHKSHCQVLKAKQPTLIFNAHPPKFPGCPPEPLSAGASQLEITEHEEDLRSWSKAAHKFACFHEICFLPHENLCGGPHSVVAVSWETFCAKIHAMEHSDLLIDKLRLHAMFTFIYGFRSDHRKRILFSNHRHRSTTRWSDQEQKETMKMFSLLGASNKKFCDNDALEDLVNGKLVNEFFSPAKINQFHTELHFCKRQMTSINHLFGVPSSEQTEVGTRPSICCFHLDSQQEMRNTAQTICMARLEPPVVQTEMSLNSHGTRDLQALQTKVDAYLEQRHLSLSQHRVIARILQFFWVLAKQAPSHGTHSVTGMNVVMQVLQCNQHLQVPQLLVTGDPGSGKSYVIDTIRGLAAVMKIGHVATCSYNGIAAVNIDGTTICTLFKINDRSSSGKHWKLNENALLELKQKLCSSILCAVIIDEVSTIDTRIVALLHHRLQQLMNNFDAPFGGLPIFFFGDFNQLGPVQKTFIPKDMLTWALRNNRNCRHKHRSTSASLRSPASLQTNSPARSSLTAFRKHLAFRFGKSQHESQTDQRRLAAADRFQPHSLPHHGCRLFGALKRFHLLEQQRSDDPKHNSFVQKLSRGQSIELSDVLRYKHLSKKDLQDQPEEWRFAPVLVATNAERHSINRAKARLWAVHHRTHVFKWRSRLGRQVNRPSLDVLPSVHEENAFFWQFFVANAPCYLCQNINQDFGLVNGAPLRAHSITFSSPEEHLRIEQLLNSSHPPRFGDEIEILEPSSVNFAVVPSPDGKPVSQTRKHQLSMLRQLTCTFPESSPHDIVIPITTNMSPAASSDWDRFSYSTHNLLTPVATAQVRNPFPFDLAFAMTVHRAQGRTIKRVVLDLTEHPNHYTKMHFAAVFVAMSRVGNSDHIRLLPHSHLGKVFKPANAYQHLTALRPNKDAMAFCHGFSATKDSHTQGMPWVPGLALSHTGLPSLSSFKPP